jgi:hypothetical protein
MFPIAASGFFFFFFILKQGFAMLPRLILNLKSRPSLLTIGDTSVHYHTQNCTCSLFHLIVFSYSISFCTQSIFLLFPFILFVYVGSHCFFSGYRYVVHTSLAVSKGI